MTARQTVAAAVRTTTSLDWRQNQITIERIKKGIAYFFCTCMAVVFVFPLYWLAVTALKTDSEVFQLPPSLLPAISQVAEFPGGDDLYPLLAVYVEHLRDRRADDHRHADFPVHWLLTASRECAGRGAI